MQWLKCGGPHFGNRRLVCSLSKTSNVTGDVRVPNLLPLEEALFARLASQLRQSAFASDREKAT